VSPSSKDFRQVIQTAHLILQRLPLSNLTNISASSSKNGSEGQSIWPTSTKCMEVRQLSSRASAISSKYAMQKRIQCHPRNIRNSSNRNIPSMIRDGEFLQSRVFGKFGEVSDNPVLRALAIGTVADHLRQADF